jgi:hypothetical protein
LYSGPSSGPGVVAVSAEDATAIRGGKDIQIVLSSLAPIQGPDLKFSKEYIFGFLLGVTVWDAAKKRQQNWHRHLSSQLSKRYDTSVRIGNFICECANAFGLRMRRMPDRAPYGQNPNGFFVWESQSSPLVDWIFNICLGLQDNESTTYNPIKMEWALSGPEDFRKGLVQGLAESDGSVNVSGQEVEFWIRPSWDFVEDLLKTFGISSFRSREALAISKSQVTKALAVPIFSPHLRTVGYQKFVQLANAKHIARGKRLPAEIRREISRLAGERLSIPAISEKIMVSFNIILTFEAVQRWASLDLSHDNS